MEKQDIYANSSGLVKELLFGLGLSAFGALGIYLCMRNQSAALEIEVIFLWIMLYIISFPIMMGYGVLALTFYWISLLSLDGDKKSGKVAIIFSFFFLAGMVIALFAIRKRIKPLHLFTISEEGITMVTYTKTRFIAWDNVKKIRIEKIKKKRYWDNKLIIIELENPAEFIENTSGFLNKIICQSDNKEYGSPLCFGGVPSANLTVGQFYEILSNYYEYHKSLSAQYL